MSWLTRRRARKTQAEVDAERARLQKIYDDDELVARAEKALSTVFEHDRPPIDAPFPRVPERRE